MPDYRRWYAPGASIFFTLVTAHRAPFLCDDVARNTLRQAIRSVQRDRPFRIDAFVLLPDHLHAIWTLPPGDADFSTRWASIKAQFTRQWLDAGGREQIVSASQQRHRHRGVWQRRFYDHVLRDEEDASNHLQYIHYNPVKHGLVAQPSDWPFSSIHRLIRKAWLGRTWGSGDHAPDLSWADERLIEGQLE